MSQRLFFFALFFFNSIVNLNAKDLSDFSVIQKIDDGVINFTEQSIIITGSGVPDLNISNVNSARISAEKAAKRNLKIRLSKAISKIILSNGKTLEKYLTEKKNTEFLDTIVRDEDISELVSTRYFSDGSVDFVYKFPMDKYISKIVELTKEEFAGSLVTLPAPEILQVTEGSAPLKDVLIIEMKNQKIEPALFISVESQDGSVLYDINIIDEKAVSSGMAMFVRKKADFITEKLNIPNGVLTVSAQKVKEGSKIVVKKEDAVRIKAELNPEALKNGKVILLLK